MQSSTTEMKTTPPSGLLTSDRLRDSLPALSIASPHGFVWGYTGLPPETPGQVWGLVQRQRISGDNAFRFLTGRQEGCYGDLTNGLGTAPARLDRLEEMRPAKLATLAGRDFCF